MKFIILTLTMLSLTLSGCGSTSKADKEVMEVNQENTISSYKIGAVHLDENDCEIFIITEDENKEKLYPVGLDEMFRVNEAVLQFEYDLSRAPLPEGCKDCKAVVLRSVTRVKR